MATVLIVEDEDSLRDTLSRFLTREGHEVLEASDGREACDLGVSARPQVLVTDWMLKNHIHGLHVAEALRSVNSNLATILITGFPSRNLVSESDRSGVHQLIEKPFDLADLQNAVESALSAEEQPQRSVPLAVIEVVDGTVRFASDRAQQLLEQAGIARDAKRLDEILSADVIERIDDYRDDWQSVEPATGDATRWLMRACRLERDGCRRIVIWPEAEHSRTGDPRARVLLDHRGAWAPLLADPAPVIVIERDPALRRLLVSQIERVGALCYPADDLAAGSRLLEAERRVRAIVIDLDLAREDVEAWVREVRELRSDVLLIGTGGEGTEDDLLGLGLNHVLPKPWRIADLLDAMTA